MSHPEDLMPFFVAKLNPKKDKELCNKLIKQYKLDPLQFPELLKVQKFGEIKSFITQLDFQIAEECYGKDYADIMIEVLYSLKKYSEALSLIQRSPNIDTLTAQPKIQKILADIQDLSSKEEIVPVDNFLWKNDGFMPTDI